MQKKIEKTDPKILFITHDASRTGAPIVFLHFLRWLRQEHPEIQFDVLIRQGGPLVDDFKDLGVSCYEWQDNQRSVKLGARIAKALKRRIGIHPQYKTLKKLARHNYKLIYANSAACCNILSDIYEACNKPQVIIHIHELEFALRYLCNHNSVKNWVEKANALIGVSDIVLKNLKKNYHILPNRLYKVNAFVPSRTVARENAKIAICQELKLPVNSFIVGGCGTIDWRKGADLYIQVARNTMKRHLAKDPIHFVWIGGDIKSKTWYQIQHDIKNSGLSECVHFIGSVKNAEDFFATFDVLIVSSREDPFPLICLEAARSGCPIICFENAIGSTEFIDNTKGCIVPYLNVEQMAESILKYYDDKSRLTSASNAIKQAIPETNQANCCKALFKIIKQIQNKKT